MGVRIFCFVGEKRSNTAKRMKVTWEDGRLAAKQLFDALRIAGIKPEYCVFVNIFERDGRIRVRQYAPYMRIVGMGLKVQRELDKLNIPYIALVHPAARGSIRKKEHYANHVKKQLLGLDQ